ncbi:MAG: hypothetical protein Q7S16_00065, partial [bacterium]|nr:hypothetical protein [bacterium]
QTNSLNFGLQKARGIYVARTDAGDISLPKRFGTQVVYLEAHLEVAVVGTGAIRYNPEGKVIDVLRMPGDALTMRQMAVVTNPIIHISTMMRKDIIIKVGSYRLEYPIAADYDLWSRLLKSSFSLVNIPDILAGYEVSSESLNGIHRSGTLIKEVSKIIQSNVGAFTQHSISLKQAEDLYKFFMLDMDMLSRDDIENTARLYAELMTTLQLPRREIHYQLLRKYAKYIACHRGGFSLNDRFAVARLFFEKSDGLFSWQGIVQDINRRWQGILWRHNFLWKY